MNLDGLQLSLSETKTWFVQGNSSAAEDNSEEMGVGGTRKKKHYQVLASKYSFSRDIVLVYA